MRDYIILYVNGVKKVIKDEKVFLPLSDYLRYELGLTGAKVVCAEGDCGACSILQGTVDTSKSELKYKSINSCISFVYLCDCTHIVTVEGLGSSSNPSIVQKAMAEHYGTQCGYCTSGFICTITDLLNKHSYQKKNFNDKKTYLSIREIKNALTGNLCRCTGYEPIVDACKSIDIGDFKPLQEVFDSKEMYNDLAENKKIEVKIVTPDKVFYAPTTFENSLKAREGSKSNYLISSATDIGVLVNKDKIDPDVMINLELIPEAHILHKENDMVVVGPKVTLSRLRKYLKHLIPEFSKLLHRFASPQIKNKATLVGNIANASPIGDTLPFLFIDNAEVELMSLEGTRRVNINNFYKGYKILDIKHNEIISKIYIPIPKQEQIIQLYKVSNRKDLDISTFTAGFMLDLDKESNTIENISIAYGGVAPVVLRLSKTEAFLKGEKLELETFENAQEVVLSEIAPISDVRASAEYRKELAKNALLKFFYDISE